MNNYTSHAYSLFNVIMINVNEIYNWKVDSRERETVHMAGGDDG